MAKCVAPALLGALLSMTALTSDADTVLAQVTTPSLPGAPQPTPNLPAGSQPASRLPQGPQGGSGSYVVSAAANEHASFLWVVDSVQRSVMLCEKADSREFTCTKKPLP